MNALVIGHTSEIGRAIQHRLNEYGFTVIGWSRSDGVDITNSKTWTKLPILDAIILVAEAGVSGADAVIFMAKDGYLAKDGCVIAISSVHVHVARDAYAMSKIAQEYRILRAAVELKMRFNVLRLGHITPSKAWPKEDPTRIDEIPLGRFGNPSEVAQAITFMIGSRWLCGSLITLDGGITAQLALNEIKKQSKAKT